MQDQTDPHEPVSHPHAALVAAHAQDMIDFFLRKERGEGRSVRALRHVNLFNLLRFREEHALHGAIQEVQL